MILSNSFDPDIRVYKEAFALTQNGMKVKIHCWDRNSSKKEYEDVDGIEIIRYRIKSKFGTGVKQLPAYLKFSYKVLKALKKERNIIVHCHDFDTMLIGLLTHKKIYKVFDMHENYNYEMVGLKSKIYTILYKRGLAKFDKFIYISNQQLNKLPLKVNKDKLIYLPNYPRTMDYTPIEKSKSDTLRVNYVGVVRDTKSLETLIKCSLYDYEIGIYGSGVGYEVINLFNKCYTSKLYGHFDGIKDTSRIYRNTDILYCVYDPKNFNWKNAYFVKLYEAIITKTPIIVAKNTLAGDFVTLNQIGCAVDYGNEEELLNAIKLIEVNYDAIVEKFNGLSEMYAWEQVAMKFINEFKEISI